MVKTKRLTVFALILIVIMLAVGCGEKTPEGFTEDEYEKCKKVLNITNEFLNADISAEEASNKLEVLSDQLDSDNSTPDLIGTYAALIASEIKRYNIDGWSSHIDEIVEYRDKIQEKLE